MKLQDTFYSIIGEDEEQMKKMYLDNGEGSCEITT